MQDICRILEMNIDCVVTIERLAPQCCRLVAKNKFLDVPDLMVYGPEPRATLTAAHELYRGNRLGSWALNKEGMPMAVRQNDQAIVTERYYERISESIRALLIHLAAVAGNALPVHLSSPADPPDGERRGSQSL